MIPFPYDDDIDWNARPPMVPGTTIDSWPPLPFSGHDVNWSSELGFLLHEIGGIVRLEVRRELPWFPRSSDD